MADGAQLKRRGRPPKPEAERTRGNITFRSRPGTRELLESSATKHNRSLSEEVEARLVQSFNYDDVYRAVDDGFARNMRLYFGGDEHAVTMIELAGYLRRAFEAADKQVASSEAWHSNDLKRQIAEDTFVHLARRAIKATAVRERRDAERKKSHAEDVAANE